MTSAFHRLAVDDCQAGFGIASRLNTDGTPQSIIDFFPLSIPFETVKVPSDCSFGRKIVWEQTPLTSGASLVKDGVEDFPQVGRFGRTARWQNDLRSDEFPLFVAQVGIVGFADHKEEKRRGVV